mmetsp:Transcript_10613/g.19142  ORF Transcript_10613/g.19142 Transcript_10613/m.19142 type:complete len:455 (-) Transcript_10613:343-1707(-)|eukprot:CAMPEP_0182445576 /NCGR_PEP_ID=MMETSP1172-20130603/3659_1 /TAXON_ID=708627 /ORGANISM="Timspurckia oligopyrenoides, Strain CCMP3278" /LENGTH=454 /DNA_ID=CAMNT_0024641379 /DNA_START=167 /DNA_END=1531 /DNA_ORIENTATION=-
MPVTRSLSALGPIRKPQRFQPQECQPQRKSKATPVKEKINLSILDCPPYGNNVGTKYDGNVEHFESSIVTIPPVSKIRSPLLKAADRLSLGWKPEKFIARDKETEKLRAVLDSWIWQRQCGNVYMSGLPGCGKTRTVEALIAKMDKKHFVSVYLNCGNINSQDSFYSIFLHELQLACGIDRFSLHSSSDGKLARQKVIQLALKNAKPVMVVLDEVDFLVVKNPLVLHSIFELSKESKNRMAIVSIANALDLPQKLLPWLTVSSSMPHILPFEPYSSFELNAIVEQRLEDIPNTIDSASILLCVRSIAASTGDIRTALEVLRLAATDANADAEALGKEPPSSLIRYVSNILHRRGGLGATLQAVRQLPLQQQIVLIALVRCTRNKSKPNTTLGGLSDEAQQTFKLLRVQPIHFSEICDVCSTSLQHHNLVQVQVSKNVRKSPIVLKASSEDIYDC